MPARAMCLKEMKERCSGVSLDAAYWTDVMVEDAWRIWSAAGMPRFTTVVKNNEGKMVLVAKHFPKRRNHG